ncbi:MAG: response regulator [Proteobacteria bacterium]|nr:response regulator [Pseudomonadota bacterium]
MDQTNISPPPEAARRPGQTQMGAAGEYWFGSGLQKPEAAITGSEKYIGVALAGGLTALATIGFYLVDGNLAGATPVVSLILFFTVLAIGFFMLSAKDQVTRMDPKIMAAALAHMDEATVLSDREGRLLSANKKYQDFFKGRSPSIKKLLFDRIYGETIRMLLKASLEGHSASLRVQGGEDQTSPLITARPQGPFIMWTFAQAGVSATPLAAVGNMEDHFQALLDRFSLGLVITGKNKRIRYANPFATELLGVKPKAIHNKDAEEVFSAKLLRAKNLTVDWLDIPGAEDGKSEFYFALVQKLGEEGAEAAPVGSKEFAEYVADAPIAIAVVDTLDFRVEQLNRACFDLFGKYNKKPLLKGDILTDFMPKETKAPLKQKVKTAKQGKDLQTPLEFFFDAAGKDVIQAFFSPLKGGNRRLGILYLIDTSETKRLELQFVQAQKMQAVGQLAGGVAHDFNNLLTAILGFCDLLLMRHKAGDQSFADLIQIKQNANRAADLIRQLLAFSRRQALHPKVLDVTDILSDLTNLIRRLIGEKITLRMTNAKNLRKIRADQSQFEQVIVNLAVNARDAMPEGGTLTITTQNIAARDIPKLGRSGLKENDYVRIMVSDTGTGIAKEHLDKVFEPFFTTKEVGKGTGLGLSTAYGIITQTGGAIFVDSKQGEGSTFDIFFPALDPAEKVETTKPAEKDAVPRDLTGTEVILFVEDEDPVRTFVSRALQNKGYKVLEADNGEAALEVLESYTGPIDLLISDVVMPQMDGPTLARKVIGKYPEIKIILISGYAEIGFHKGLKRDRFSFIPKPFSLQVLAEKVRTVLDEGKK